MEMLIELNSCVVTESYVSELRYMFGLDRVFWFRETRYGTLV